MNFVQFAACLEISPVFEKNTIKLLSIVGLCYGFSAFGRYQLQLVSHRLLRMIIAFIWSNFDNIMRYNNDI